MSDGSLHKEVVVDQVSRLPQVDLQSVHLGNNRDTGVTSKLKRIMWTIFLFLGSSLPVKAGSSQDGAEGNGGIVQEEFGGEGGAREATAAREEMGWSLKGGLKQVSSPLPSSSFFGSSEPFL